MKFSLAGCHPTRKRLPQWFTWKFSKNFLWICLLPTKCIGVSLVLRSGNLLQAPTTGRQPPTRSLAPLSILVGDMVGWPPTPGSRWVSKYAFSPHLGHKSEGNWWVQHQGQVSPQPTLGGEAKLLAWACLRQRCLKGQNVLFMGNWNSHLLNWRVLETSVKEYKTAWYRRHLWAMGVPSMWQGWCWSSRKLLPDQLGQRRGGRVSRRGHRRRWHRCAGEQAGGRPPVKTILILFCLNNIFFFFFARLN